MLKKQQANLKNCSKEHYKEAGKKADVEGTTPSYVRLSISGGGKSSTSIYTPGAPIQMQKEEAQKEQPFEVEVNFRIII